MTSRDFCYWLQGYLELAYMGTTSALTEDQVKCIAKHLGMVFKHEIDPSFGDKKHQEALDKIHNTGSPGGPIMRC